MSTPHLYAALIGINAYDRNPLDGCIRDVLSVDDLLRQLSGAGENSPFNYLPEYYLAPGEDDQAEVEDHVRTYGISPATIKKPGFHEITQDVFAHLSKAADGDICLFYYSGHGSFTA